MGERPHMAVAAAELDSGMSAPITIKGISFCKWQECLSAEAYAGPRQTKLAQSDRVSARWLQDLKVDAAAMSDLRRLVQSIDLGKDLSRMDDNEIITEFVHMLDRKSLCRCDGNKNDGAGKRPAGGDRTRTPVEAVIRVLAGGNRQFSLEGQMLRVIHAEQWRGMREEGGYQIIPPTEARQTILKLAAMPSATAEEKSAWQKALDLLAQSRAGRFESGLLLLRIVPRRNFKSPSAEPAITPSQLAQLVKHWVEIELVDETGAPVPDVSYSITAPDNQVYTGVTDAAGMARVDNIPPGQCQISFPELDKDAYKAA